MAASSLRTLLRWVGVGLLVPSVMALLGGLWLLGSARHWWGDTQQAQARVVALEAAQLNRGTGHGARSIVEFQDRDGRRLRVTDPVLRQGDAMHRVGDTVHVRYPQGRPEQAQIGSSALLQTVLGVLLCVLGGGSVLLGLVMLRLARRPHTDAAEAA